MKPARGCGRRRRERERGSGLFGTTFGVFVFLLMMLVSVNVMYALYARSMVTNAAYDAARSVAGYRSAAGREEAQLAATSRFAQQVGGINAHLEWISDDADVIEVRVVADPPSLLPRGLRDVFGVSHTDRRIRIRVEREQ